MLISAIALSLASMDPSFHANWNATPDRVWIGEDWWANRLQDWKVEHGSLWCTEARPTLSMRTAQLLTRTVDATTGEAVFSVVIRPLDDWPEDAVAGFLLGGGSP